MGCREGIERWWTLLRSVSGFCWEYFNSCATSREAQTTDAADGRMVSCEEQ